MINQLLVHILPITSDLDKFWKGDAIGLYAVTALLAILAHIVIIPLAFAIFSGVCIKNKFDCLNCNLCTSLSTKIVITFSGVVVMLLCTIFITICVNGNVISILLFIGKTYLCIFVAIGGISFITGGIYLIIKIGPFVTDLLLKLSKDIK